VKSRGIPKKKTPLRWWYMVTQNADDEGHEIVFSIENMEVNIA
jgi:hypothetical protein